MPPFPFPKELFPPGRAIPHVHADSSVQRSLRITQQPSYHDCCKPQGCARRQSVCNWPPHTGSHDLQKP
eukprot:scaffold37845_cov16-Prasinocladus_malaysianus.AAC.1